jgi:hypothetical protein
MHRITVIIVGELSTWLACTEITVIVVGELSAWLACTEITVIIVGFKLKAVLAERGVRERERDCERERERECVRERERDFWGYKISGLLSGFWSNDSLLVHYSV